MGPFSKGFPSIRELEGVFAELCFLLWGSPGEVSSPKDDTFCLSTDDCLFIQARPRRSKSTRLAEWLFRAGHKSLCGLNGDCCCCHWNHLFARG